MSWIDLDPGEHEIADASISDYDDGHDDQYEGDDHELDESDSTSEDDSQSDDLADNDHDHDEPEEKAPAQGAGTRKRGRPRKPAGNLKRLPMKTRQVLSEGYAATEYLQTCCNYRYVITMRIKTVCSSTLPLAVAGMARSRWIE
jgi:hypothetical protein